MDEMGKAMMGTGEDAGEDRAVQAAEKAIANPLLDEISLKGAKGVLINITGSHDLTLFELDEAANRIREEVDADANIIVGSTLDTSMDGTMRVSVVATGIDATDNTHDIPVPRRSLAEPLKPAQQVQDETPVEAETPAPVAARSAEEQPSMFNDLDAQRAAAEDQMEDIFEEAPAEQAQDDVPPRRTPRVWNNLIRSTGPRPTWTTTHSLMPLLPRRPRPRAPRRPRPWPGCNMLSATPRASARRRRRNNRKHGRSNRNHRRNNRSHRPSSRMETSRMKNRVLVSIRSSIG